MATRGKKIRKRAAVGKKARTAAKKRGATRSAAAKREKLSASSRRTKRVVVAASGPAKKAVIVADKPSPITRVKRVAKEVAHQATTAVSTGVGAIKEFGENIVERVTG